MTTTLSHTDGSINIDTNQHVLKNNTLKFALRDWKAKVTSYTCDEVYDTSILIPTADLSEFEFQDLFRDILGVFKEIGIEIEVAENASNKMKELQDDDAAFLRESTAARNVWDGDLDIPEFKEFSKVIKEKISSNGFPDGLYEKQLLAAYHLAASGSACNFSVPGAGKTVNVWAAYSYLNSLPEDDPRYVNAIFVIGPSPCFEPWETEFEKCFERKSKSVRFLPSLTLAEKRRIIKGIIQSDTELYMCHFQTFSLYVDDFLELFERPDKKIMLVVDEAHWIKGNNGVWSNAALKAAPLAHSRIILTGTPAPNGYEDLKNLFDFIHPNRNIIGFSRSALRQMSDNRLNAKELTERIKPFYIRIKKSDLNIPPQSFEVIPIKMSVIQEKVYEEIESKFFSGQTVKLFKHGNLIRLMQAASNPLELLKPIDKELYQGDIDDESAKRITEVAEYLKEFKNEADLPKLDYLIKLAKKAKENEEKIIIWSYFLGNIQLIYKHLSNLVDCPVHMITGAVPMGEGDKESSYIDEAKYEITREKILKSFRGANGASILIATPQCVGESISLHLECHKAIYYDRNFNCGLFIQSKDRIHRKGLPADTITKYIYLNSSNSVDDQIHERLDEKESRMMKLLESGEIPLMTDNYNQEKKEDVKKVLEAYYAKQL